MNLKLKKLNLNYRKLKLSDYNEFRKLFSLCFKRKISFNFFKWRYFDDNISFCYGVFQSHKLIANVGLVFVKLNDKKNTKVFSRHSSMVSPKYRKIGLFSELLDRVKKKYLKKIPFLIMWPNQNNFASFGIKKKNTIKKKYFLYQITSQNKIFNNVKKISIENLLLLKKNFNNNNSFFLKNFNYLNHRYMMYKKNDYFINEFHYKNFRSFFIIKTIKQNSYLNYVILEHFGSEGLFNKHLNNLNNNYNRIILLTKNKVNKKNYKLLNIVKFNIGLIKKNNFKINKKIFLGDTDIFITL